MINIIKDIKSIIEYIKAHVVISMYVISMTIFLCITLLGVGKVPLMSVNFQTGLIAIMQLVFCYGILKALSIDYRIKQNQIEEEGVE